MKAESIIERFKSKEPVVNWVQCTVNYYNKERKKQQKNKPIWTEDADVLHLYTYTIFNIDGNVCRSPLLPKNHNTRELNRFS